MCSSGRPWRFEYARRRTNREDERVWTEKNLGTRDRGKYQLSPLENLLRVLLSVYLRFSGRRRDRSLVSCIGTGRG